jgi:hypothetical protein
MPLDKNILKKKVFGIPVPILAVGAGVVGVIAYRKFGAGKSSSTSDGSATASDYSGGSAGSGGSASDYSGGTGDYGSSADLGLGAGGGASYDIGGGAYLPATNAGPLGGQPIVNKFIHITRPRRGRARRPTIVNKTVLNFGAIPKNKRRPNVVHGDRNVPSPTHDPRRNGGAATGQRRRDPYRTPPIIRRGQRPRAGSH